MSGPQRTPSRDALLAIHRVVTVLTSIICAIAWVLAGLDASHRATSNPLWLALAAFLLPPAVGMWLGQWLIDRHRGSPRR